MAGSIADMHRFKICVRSEGKLTAFLFLERKDTIHHSNLACRLHPATMYLQVVINKITKCPNSRINHRDSACFWRKNATLSS